MINLKKNKKTGIINEITCILISDMIYYCWFKIYFVTFLFFGDRIRVKSNLKKEVTTWKQKNIKILL